MRKTIHEAEQQVSADIAPVRSGKQLNLTIMCTRVLRKKGSFCTHMPHLNDDSLLEKMTPMKSIAHDVLTLCIGLVIFLGIPFLGWGIQKLSGFFDNPARLSYAIVILLLQVFSIIYHPQVGQNRENRKSGVKKHTLDIFLIQILSISIVFIAPFSDGHSIGTWNIGEFGRFLGFILLIPGFVLMQMAEKHLGKQFSIEVTLQKDHTLIQDGPYRFIRHPRYLGVLAFFTGISVVFQSLFSIFLVVMLCVIIMWRVYAEEALLFQEFGKEWEAYRKKSWRIIPFLY